MDYWKPSVALLNDKDFLSNLKTYDKDNINPKIIARIRKEYTSNPEFTPERAANASAAAEGLCKWVTAMDKYDNVAKVRAVSTGFAFSSAAEAHAFPSLFCFPSANQHAFPNARCSTLRRCELVPIVLAAFASINIATCALSSNIA